MDSLFKVVIIVLTVVVLKMLYSWIKHRLDKRDQDVIDNQIISGHAQHASPNDIPSVSSEDLTKEMMNTSCSFMTQENQKMILKFNQINISKLDFSISSIDEIDLWMNSIWQSKSNLNSNLLGETLLWAGSYIGEVIRRNSSKQFRWIGYREFIEKYGVNNMSIMPYSFEYQYILDCSSNTASFPFSKVSKYLDNGPEENLKFFVTKWCETT
ncbi:MAG: hypothetical protein IPK50_17725 [Fibrobacterota bacterium]|nr:MAG: hypothetical protein IPK50_17725 [Fibrobacterota bacterium]